MSATKQEWAIQDAATGQWYRESGEWPSPERWCNDPNQAARFDTHYEAAQRPPFDGRWQQVKRETARIVPAPPREMTDAECWKYLRENHYFAVTSYSPDIWAIWDISGDNGHGDWLGGDANVVTGATPCDAIRAARRKLEAEP